MDLLIQGLFSLIVMGGNAFSNRWNHTATRKLTLAAIEESEKRLLKKIDDLEERLRSEMAALELSLRDEMKNKIDYRDYSAKISALHTELNAVRVELAVLKAARA